MAEQKTGFTGHRKAVIETVNGDGTYDIYYADDNSNNPIKGVSASNVGSFGSGVFTRYHHGAQVWVGQSYYYQPLIVGFADMPGSIEQAQGALEADDIDAPSVEPGEVILQAKSGAHIDLRNDGNIKISNLKNDGIFLSDAHRALIVNSQQHYVLSESGYTVEGRVRRFHPGYTPGKDPVFVDLLSDPEADAFAIEIARDPSQKSLPMNRARGTANVLRNPAFAEKREMILEFADSFFVRDAQAETDLAAEFPKNIQEMDRSIAKRRGYGTNEQNFDNLRHASRTNLLKLDSNVIIERVQGTLVDIFGNVLDINYNKINLPKITQKGKDAIEESHLLLSRSVAYHFQVNSRSVLTDDATGSSKFTLDIDKQGQFKLNVPRTASSGTVPTISSFVSGSANLNSRIDVSNVQLSQSQIPTPTGGSAGTAFHDMTLTADRLIRYTLQTINPIKVHNNTLGIQEKGDTPNIEVLFNSSTKTSVIPQYTTTVSVKNGAPAISDEVTAAHAGGRSGLMNFEGSLEVSIGKDEIDEKSLMLDTAGSLVAWFGMDRHGRSAVVNADGAVLFNIGDYATDNNGNNKFHQGTLAIRVNLADDQNPNIGELQAGKLASNKTTSDHIIYVGPQGIVISSGHGTPIAIRSGGDILLEANGTFDVKAKEIRLDAGYLRKVKPSKGDI